VVTVEPRDNRTVTGARTLRARQRIAVSKRKLPLHPGHPERICWGCDKYCPADDLACGNGTDRAQHPVEIFGRDWLELGLDATQESDGDAPKD
jgi:hypothetical protein